MNAHRLDTDEKLVYANKAGETRSILVLRDIKHLVQPLQGHMGICKNLHNHGGALAWCQSQLLT